MTTEQLPDGRWAATVKPRPGVVVTAYGASEAEAIENAQRVEAALKERRCEVSRENLLDSDHKEAIHNSDGKLLGYLNRNGALVDPTQREVDQDRFDMDMWADGQRKQKRVTRDDDLAGVIESQERRDGK